ncbi:HEAT repeat domain-containing protein [Embleya sp. AB8]|uniref:HEAT repeat domain-containing protein n=1 Tax=Embleya sp. AB8 TaxID=3156304 RepID=UPI003C73DFD0
MSTSGQSVVSAAVRRGDVDWLSAYFAGMLPSDAVLRRLVGHAEPAVRHLGVLLLRERAGVDGSVAALLPEVVAGCAETALVLADTHARLRVPVPQWRDAGWPARVRIGWLRAELVARPEATLRAEPSGEELYRAVGGIEAAAVDDVDGLLRGLLARPDPVLRAEALRVVREALYGALLGPGAARDRLVELLDPVGGGEVVAGALAELGKPWAAVESPVGLEPALRRLVSRYPEAVEVAARFGAGGLLREVASAGELPGRQRQRALRLIGEFARRGEAAGLLAIAGTDPLLFARPLVACLGAMHRRGHFVRPADVPAVLDLALADYRVAAADVAVVLFTVRHEVLRVLAAVPDEDPHWPRCVELLSASAAQGAPDLPVGELLTARPASTDRPEPVLAELRRLRYVGAEDAVLAVLPRAPRAALSVLAEIGGPGTVAALRAGLGVSDPAGVVVPHLRGVADDALAVLWHLTEDPDQRRELRARLDRARIPERIRADLGMPDPDELGLLTADLDVDRPVDALCRLAGIGDARTIPALADLLLRVVSDLVERRDAEVAEPVVPNEVVEALGALGERLYGRRVLRPVCLLDAADAPAARTALLTDVTLDLLDRTGVTGAELAVLLELLGRLPGTRVRDRIHRLVRHPDPQVRKRAIALLVRDADRDDARVLSATLIPLTAAADPQTVRQAVRALGHARAEWAAEAIAACLEHPVMNIKKTAADALSRAGTPAQVPVLLGWLARHDNPGLRASSTTALRAILGKTYAAHVLAAAERTDAARERRLLVAALDGELSVRAVRLLARRGSPVAEPLLTGMARGELRPAFGEPADLAAELAADGLAVDGLAVPDPVDGEDADVRAELMTVLRPGGLDAEPVALLRLARQAAAPSAHQPTGLRRALPQLLAVARDRPADRAALLRLVLRACPAPWSAAERTAFAAAYDVLAAELGAVEEVGNVLEAVAGALGEPAAFVLATRVRALPSFAGPLPLAVLRGCRAVLTRADVDRALAGARLGPNPWEAEVAVLRVAFGPVAGSDPDPEPAAAADAAWRARLGDAVRSSARPLAAFRAEAGDPADLDSRARVAALIDAFPSAAVVHRAGLLDWLTELQPIDAPPWVLAEQAARTAPAGVRMPRPDDLDQPRSTAQRTRLLAMLTAAEPSRRAAAARVLRGWAEPEVQRVLLDAHLRGTVDVAPDVHLAAGALEVADFAGYDEAGRERAARMCERLPTELLEKLAPQLVAWWEHGAPATRVAAAEAIRRLDGDTIAEVLRSRIEAGAWGCLDLMIPGRVRRTPELTEAVRRLRAEGRAALADRLSLVDPLLRRPDAPVRNGTALAVLRRRVVPVGVEHPSRAELIHIVRTDGPEPARRALSRLADEHGGDPEVRDLVLELLDHPLPRLRLHAHRISRRILDRPEYLRHTEKLLDDPRRDIVRAAIRTVSHAGWQPAVPSLITLLGSADPVLREAAGVGLTRIGPPALPALRRAAAQARPDRRARYTELSDRITAAPS